MHRAKNDSGYQVHKIQNIPALGWKQRSSYRYQCKEAIPKDYIYQAWGQTCSTAKKL